MPYLDENGKWKATPDFKRQVDETKWLEGEYRKWLEGWGNLTGEHYFYLTYGCLQDLRGKRFRPYWRDGDCLVFDSYSEAKKNKKDVLYVKRREYGISSVFGGGIPFYNSIIDKGATNIITSADRTRLNDIKNNKLRPIMDYAEKEKVKILPTDSYYDSTAGFIFKPKTDKNAEGSQILYIETSSSVEAALNLEGFRAPYIFLDEWFLHNRAEIVLESCRATMNKGLNKEGIIVMGGSCNAVNKEGVIRLEKMIQQADALGIMVVFIPGWMCMEGAMEEIDGCFFSLKDKAIEAIHKKRQKYQESGAWEALDNYVKSYPLYMSELIESANSEIFGAEIRQKLNESKQLAIDAEVLQCNLLLSGSKVVTQEDPNGVFFIYEKPQQGHTYIAGGDPIPGNSPNMNEDRSKFVTLIKDVTTGQYVAYMKLRDMDMSNIYNKWKNLLYYYKSDAYPLGAPCMFERNRAEAMLQLCRVYNTMYLLAGDPEKIKKNFYDRGYYKGPGDTNSDKLDSVMRNYLTYNTINILPLLDDLDKYPKKTDMVDALQATEFYSSFFSKAPIQDFKEDKRPVLKRENGRTKWVWE